MRKKKLIQLLLTIMVIALFGGILFVANSIVGNPISALIAYNAIERYVDQTYPHLDLEIEKARYNFKFESYMARAQSPTSKDTKFAIYYGDGKVLRDDYEFYVLGKYNTFNRLSNEYSAVAENIISEKLGYENISTTVLYDKASFENAKDALELDMEFDRSLPIDTQITVGLNLNDHSLEKAADALTNVHQVLKKNGCNFNKYSLYIENEENLLMVNQVTSSDIESGQLLSLLEEAQRSNGANGISVKTKGEEK